MKKKLINVKKKAVISQLLMNCLLNELRLIFATDLKINAYNNNTTIQIYSNWNVLVADFYYENSDIIIVKFTGAWSEYYKNMVKTSILKIFKWDFIHENNCCCGFFVKKNQFRFMI